MTGIAVTALLGADLALAVAACAMLIRVLLRDDSMEGELLALICGGLSLLCSGALIGLGLWRILG